ncbi:unnamed protein product [Brassica oleracea]
MIQIDFLSVWIDQEAVRDKLCLCGFRCILLLVLHQF